MKPNEVFGVGVVSVGVGVGHVLGRGGGRAAFTSYFGHGEAQSPGCVLCLGEGAGAGLGLLCSSPSLSARLPILLLFFLHMPGPRSAQTVEISFAENCTSDQNVS